MRKWVKLKWGDGLMMILRKTQVWEWGEDQNPEWKSPVEIKRETFGGTRREIASLEIIPETTQETSRKMKEPDTVVLVVEKR